MFSVIFKDKKPHTHYFCVLVTETMDSAGFYNDNYCSDSSDDDLVDLSGDAEDLLEDVPCLEPNHYSGTYTCTAFPVSMALGFICL